MINIFTPEVEKELDYLIKKLQWEREGYTVIENIKFETVDNIVIDEKEEKLLDEY